MLSRHQEGFLDQELDLSLITQSEQSPQQPYKMEQQKATMQVAPHTTTSPRVLSFEEARQIYLEGSGTSHHGLQRHPGGPCLGLAHQGDIVCNRRLSSFQTNDHLLFQQHCATPPTTLSTLAPPPQTQTQLSSPCPNIQYISFERAAKSSSLKSAKTATVVVEPLLQSSEANLQSSHRSESKKDNSRMCNKSRGYKILELRPVWRGGREKVCELLESVSKLDKVYLVLMWASLYLSVFSLSLILLLSFVWGPHAHVFPQQRLSSSLVHKTTSSLEPQISTQTTPIRVSNTLASPMDTPANTTPLMSTDSGGAGDRARQQRGDSSPLGHLPVIDECFVNWTRLSISWSYDNKQTIDNSNQNTPAIQKGIKLFCLHKTVLRGSETVSSEYVLLPSTVDSFKYYRGGYGERHGNNLFMLSLAPCFNAAAGSSRWNETNGHLGKHSNDSSSVFVAAGFVTKKSFFCSYTYDITALYQLIHLPTQKVLLKQKHSDFIDACSKACNL